MGIFNPVNPWGASGQSGMLGNVQQSLSATPILAEAGANIDGTLLDKPTLQRLLQVERFVDYLTKAHPGIGELWTAFTVAERVGK